jgi:hypothetical protein
MYMYRSRQSKGFYNRLQKSQKRATVMRSLKEGTNFRKKNAEMCASEAEHVTFKDVYLPGGSMSSIRWDAAVGMITLQWTLFFIPFTATILFRSPQPHLGSTAAKISIQKSHPKKHIKQPPHTSLFFLILLNSAFSPALARVLLNDKVKRLC